MPLLSIIVPVYNKSNYINDTVQSILSQTYTDFELILVNDGSTDNSGDKCDNFASIDKRVTVFHQNNQGVSAARNAGLDLCKGEYIGFVDADDILEPDMYETLINNAKKYNADVTICGVKRIFEDKIQFRGGKGVIKVYDNDEGVSAYLKRNILMSNYDKLFRREAVKNIRFPPPLYEDTFYNFEALKNSKLTVYDDSMKYNYIMRENSHSMAPFNKKYMNMAVLSKRILNICINELPNHVDEAKLFDFSTNMIVLNLIVIESKTDHQNDYNIIYNNLKAYKSDFKNIKGISAKYNFGYRIFLLSPKIYTWMLKLYSILTNSEYLDRKENAKK